MKTRTLLAAVVALTASLAAQAGGPILLDELNQVGTVAFDSSFSLISYTRATGGILTVGTVDGLAGINAGSGLFGSPQPVVLRGQQIDVNAPIRGNDVTLLPFASGAIDFIAEPTAKTGFQLKQSELDRITADRVTIGEAASASLSVSALPPDWLAGRRLRGLRRCWTETSRLWTGRAWRSRALAASIRLSVRMRLH